MPFSKNAPTRNPAETKAKDVRLYAHWLDGEWQKIAAPITVSRHFMSLQRAAEGWLKLHALFGTRVALSDVQLTDSPILAKLFVDPEFRNYVKHDPSFLTLVAYPRSGFNGLNERLGRATRGLERAHRNGWKTSLPSITVDEIKRFSDPILSADSESYTARWLNDRFSGPGKVIASLPHHRELLEGMLHGICHFIRKTGGPSETPTQSEPRFYTDFIMDVLNSNGLGREEYNALEKVWLEIEKLWVPDPDTRKNRSALLNAMEAKEPDRSKWPPEWHRIWNTVVHAWNENVSTTVGAGRSSISELPEAIIPFHGIISDIVEQEQSGLLRARMPQKYPLLSFDPATLTWKEIYEIVKLTRSLRKRFQSSLRQRDDEGISALGDELVTKLAEAITVTPKGPPKTGWLMLSAVTAISPVLLSYTDASALPAAAVASAAVLARIKFLSDLKSYFGFHISQFRVLNTLRGYQNELVSALVTGHQSDE
jgi:hypothetical protein